MDRHKQVMFALVTILLFVGMAGFTAPLPMTDASKPVESQHQVSQEVKTYTESFEGSWPPTGWHEHSYYGHTDWRRCGAGAKSGRYYASISGQELWTGSGILESRVYDLHGRTSLTFSCWFKDNGIDNGDLRIYFKNSQGSWTYICDLNVAAGSPDFFGWRFYQYTTTSSSFLHSGFQIRYYAKNIAQHEEAGIDYQCVSHPDPIDKYALLVATGVSAAHDDVQYWQTKLRALGFKSENIHTYLDSNTGKDLIRQQARWLASVADSNDKIVFAFSGHGDRESGSSGYIWLYYERYYDSELRADLGSTRAHNALVFICACRSGCFIDDFQGLSNFYVSTACTVDGHTSGMSFVSDTEPAVKSSYSSGNTLPYSMWTYFFVKNLGSGRVETTFSNGVSQFRSWYDGGHWCWRHVGWTKAVPPERPTPIFRWVYETWSWPAGGQPDGGAQKGVPQSMDGNPGSSFYL
ncbi:MAG: caspase family protein [Candidatus Thorarchaeota archaeon]